MKTLQSNFTTPEQSKRLLELGVPAYSADCYIHISECVMYNLVEKREETYKKCEYGVIGGSGIFGKEIPARLHLPDNTPEYLPCWSVGRLIEIMGLCYDFEFPSQGAIQIYKTDIEKGSVIDILISDIERFINKIDFSKLEE